MSYDLLGHFEFIDVYVPVWSDPCGGADLQTYMEKGIDGKWRPHKPGIGSCEEDNSFVKKVTQHYPALQFNAYDSQEEVEAACCVPTIPITCCGTTPVPGTIPFTVSNMSYGSGWPTSVSDNLEILKDGDEYTCVWGFFYPVEEYSTYWYGLWFVLNNTSGPLGGFIGTVKAAKYKSDGHIVVGSLLDTYSFYPSCLLSGSGTGTRSHNYVWG